MNLIKSVLLGLIVVFLAGCQTTQVRVVSSETRVLLEPDPVYLKDCEVISPPQPERYAKMNMDEREDVLTRILLSATTAAQECNLSKKNLRELLAKQKQIIDEFNASEKVRVEQEKKRLEN